MRIGVDWLQETRPCTWWKVGELGRLPCTSGIKLSVYLDTGCASQAWATTMQNELMTDCGTAMFNFRISKSRSYSMGPLSCLQTGMLTEEKHRVPE